ncbi:MAG: CheR family methyltransferase [Thermoleophilia bacterium]
MIPKRKFDLSEDDFERFRKIIDQASGIFFDRSKWELLRLGLTDRAEATDAKSLSDYYEKITSAADGEDELRCLLDHLSVQETQFFRNLPQFDALRKYVIPEIARRKKNGHRSIRLWSAGCSTGQEPYSLAMAALDVLPDPGSWNIQILGTDLNQQALAIAEKGWYPEKRLIGIDRSHRENYFRPLDGGFVVTEPVRRMVHFSRHNMVNDPLPMSIFGTCDVVFCRNVIIYFTHNTAKYVIEHFFDIMNPGGYLFLGHSETLWKMSAKYSLVEMGDAFIYKKSLPRSIEGRRFIPDRRIREAPLPTSVHEDRRVKISRRDVTGVEELIHKQEEQFPSKNAGTVSEEPNVQKGRSFLELGEYDKACECLAEAVKQDGSNAELFFLQGLALEKANRPDDASESYRKAIYCDENYSIAYFHMASVLERSGRLKAAVREYRNAARSLRNDQSGRWGNYLDSYDMESVINLCEWKIENLASLEE